MRWIAGVSLLALVGCVQVRHEVQVQPFGTYQSDLDLQQRANRMPTSEIPDMPVYVGELPPGMEVRDGKTVLAPGVEVLGKVSTSYTNRDAFNSWLFGGFYKMQPHQKGLQTYCSVQAPLVWFTLTMWNYLPFRYPCIAAGGDSSKAISRRKDGIITGLKRGTAALGGNAVVVTELGDMQYVVAGTDRVIGGLEMTQGGALIVKLPE